MTHESFAGPIRGNEQVAHDDIVHEHAQLDRPIPSLSPESARSAVHRAMSVSSIERPKEGRPSRRHPEDSPDARRSFGQGQDLVPSFRKAKIGQPFPEAFKDSAWTAWFIWTYEYEKSTKPEHQLSVQYLLKRLGMEIKAEHTKGYSKGLRR